MAAIFGPGGPFLNRANLMVEGILASTVSHQIILLTKCSRPATCTNFRLILYTLDLSYSTFKILLATCYKDQKGRREKCLVISNGNSSRYSPLATDQLIVSVGLVMYAHTQDNKCMKLDGLLHSLFVCGKDITLWQTLATFISHAYFRCNPNSSGLLQLRRDWHYCINFEIDTVTLPSNHSALH